MQKDNRIRVTVVVALCALGLFLRLRARAADLWLDERMYLAQMQGSFGDLLGTLAQREYFGWLQGDNFLIYPFFKLFGYNKWGLMLPHLVATVAGFTLLYGIGTRYFKTLGAFVICFAVVALNPTLIFHALEINYYAVFPTLALAFFYVSDKFWSSGFTGDLRRKAGYACFTVLFIWFHVYGIFTVGFMTLYFALARRKDPDFWLVARRAAVFFTGVLVMAMPFWVYNVFFNHLAYGTGYNLDHHEFAPYERNVYEFIANPSVRPVAFLKSVFGNLMGLKFFYPLYALLLAAWILPQEERLKQMGFFLTLIVLPVVFLHYLDVKNGYWFVQRQFIWTMPLLAFLLGWCFDSIVLYFKRK